MRKMASLASALSLVATVALAQEERPVDGSEITEVAPALEAYTSEDLFGTAWQDSALSKRDRSLVTIAALIARSQAEGMDGYIRFALENGASPSEISEIITHLAFYAGWQNAMIAVDAAATVFADEGISADQLPAADPQDMLPLDEEAEAERQS